MAAVAVAMRPAVAMAITAMAVTAAAMAAHPHGAAIAAPVIMTPPHPAVATVHFVDIARLRRVNRRRGARHRFGLGGQRSEAKTNNSGKGKNRKFHWFSPIGEPAAITTALVRSCL